MTCHANQSPLLYNQISRVFQSGQTCSNCDRELISGSSTIVGDAHGTYCSSLCHDKFALYQGERSLLRGTWIAIYITLAISSVLAYVILGGAK